MHFPAKEVDLETNYRTFRFLGLVDNHSIWSHGVLDEKISNETSEQRCTWYGIEGLS